MKMKVLISVCLVLVFATNIWAQGEKQEPQDCQNIINAELFLTASSPQDAYEKIVFQLDWADCRAYIDCDRIWTWQPFMEIFIIPILQYAISTTDNMCYWFAFGVIIDLSFWLKLACCCNFDQPHLQYHCYNWLYDLAYNGYMFFNYCY
jgi:hypothetical protein